MLHFTINFRKSHRQAQYPQQIVCEDRVFFFSFDHHILLCRQQQPKCDPAVRLVYPASICNLSELEMCSYQLCYHNDRYCHLYIIDLSFRITLLPKELYPCKLALVHNMFWRSLDVVLCTANCCHVTTVLYFISRLESEGHVSCASVLHAVRCPSASVVTTTVCNKT